MFNKEEKWIEIYTANGKTEADIIKSKLESEDIPVFLKYDVIGTIFGITLNGLGKVKILVPELKSEEAKILLNI
ncbi:MAG: DUF2007 domain-containing protein [Acidobacteriota bacterium]